MDDEMVCVKEMTKILFEKKRTASFLSYNWFAYLYNSSYKLRFDNIIQFNLIISRFYRIPWLFLVSYNNVSVFLLSKVAMF